MNTDYSLYLITDRNGLTEEELLLRIAHALQGGCTLVQLREKNLGGRDFFRLAQKIKKVTDAHSAPLLINDRVDIALAVKAAGVHVGQSDMPATAVCKILYPGMLLGVSAGSVAEALAAQKNGANYIGVGAVFPTSTKADAQSVSRAELEEICRAVSIPVVAVGGIGSNNIRELADSGIGGVAVVSAVLSAPDSFQAASRLKSLLRNIVPKK